MHSHASRTQACLASALGVCVSLHKHVGMQEKSQNIFITASEPEREELTAKKRTDAAWYSDEKDHYELTMHPFGREIYIITLIKNKIIQHCEDEAAAAAAQ